MSTTTHPQLPASNTGCGPDCVLIDDICRCHHGETVNQPVPAWMDDIVPAY